MGTTTTTYCRLCEAGCGLVARLDGDRLVELRPDHDHPVTRGFACSKGLLAADVHRDPSRLRRPQRRTAAGFADMAWDDAFAEIGGRLEAGEIVRVANGNGLLHAELRLDANLRAGVVAMTHGFGNAGTSGMPVAQAHPGVNVNVLAPAGAGSFDPVSGMSQVTGIPVEVTRAAT